MSEGGSPGIGTLGEHPLHAALKEHYRRPGDLVEAPVGGFVADLMRGDQLIEIQTGSFSALGKKLDHLLDHHPLTLVYPVPLATWIVTLNPDGTQRSRRKSPRRGHWLDVCEELVAFPSLLTHPHFRLELAGVHVDEVRLPDPTVRARRGKRRVSRRLLQVADVRPIPSPQALLALLPDLPDLFGTDDLAAAMKRPRALAQKVAYCLRESGAIHAVGRDRRGVRYSGAPRSGHARARRADSDAP